MLWDINPRAQRPSFAHRGRTDRLQLATMLSALTGRALVGGAAPAATAAAGLPSALQWVRRFAAEPAAAPEADATGTITQVSWRSKGALWGSTRPQKKLWRSDGGGQGLQTMILPWVGRVEGAPCL